MPDIDLQRLTVIQAVSEQRITRRDAALQLNISERQVQRLIARFRHSGPQGLVSLKRGMPSNRRLPDELKSQVLALMREHYADFGPTLAVEKLLERHGLSLSVETLRGWMIAEGLWTVRQARGTRSSKAVGRGELVHVGSDLRDWFEGRATLSYLLVFVDDATGALMHLHFDADQSQTAYFTAVRGYLQRYGAPLAFTSDKHAVAQSGAFQPLTLFAQALQNLDIELRPGSNQSARGRLNRTFKTLRDRLSKEMRIQAISSADQANTWIDEFISLYNERFARGSGIEPNLHRPVVVTVTEWNELLLVK